MANQKRLLSQEEFLDWVANPGTQSYRALLVEWRQGLMEQWAEGAFQGDTPFITAIANAQALVEVKVVSKLMELDYEQYERAFGRDEPLVAPKYKTSPMGAGVVEDGEW